MNKGGDVECDVFVVNHGEEPLNRTAQFTPHTSSAAPTFDPKGCGTVAWLIEELQKWPSDTKVYVDFDIEGGNETRVDRVEEYDDCGRKGIRIS